MIKGPIETQFAGSLIDVDGFVEERYSYETFGTQEFMDWEFNPITESQYKWEVLFHAHRCDFPNGPEFIKPSYSKILPGSLLDDDPFGSNGMLGTVHQEFKWNDVIILPTKGNP